jgi:hypothetical protein
MIRGKAFEFSVMLMLNSVLPNEIWQAEKPVLNPQLGSHDKDVVLRHLPTGKSLSIECKLAGKETFRVKASGICEIRVKCMRSRTLGAEMVRELAPKKGVSETDLSVHNDQYLADDFDVVITSLANAFYRTNEEGAFIWQPSNREEAFLTSILTDTKQPLKDFAFFRMYVAESSSLVVSRANGVQCSRRKCANPKNCGFIPNYPTIKFQHGNGRPLQRWIPIEESEDLFLRLIKSRGK